MRRGTTPSVLRVDDLHNEQMSGLFEAAVEATEEAVYNSLLKAVTVTSNGRTVEALPLELFHEHDGFISLEDTNDVTLRSRSGLRMPIAGGLDASLQLNVDWERSPAAGRKSTDASLLVGVGYRW